MYEYTLKLGYSFKREITISPSNDFSYFVFIQKIINLGNLKDFSNTKLFRLI